MKHEILSVIFICIFTHVLHSQPTSGEWENFPQTLIFTFPDSDGRNVIDTPVEITSFVPLVTKSTNVPVTKVIKDTKEVVEGISLSETSTTTGKRGAYIFNNATQCFEYGFITVINGQAYWTAASASEQYAHNICAPKGEMYCRKKL